LRREERGSETPTNIVAAGRVRYHINMNTSTLFAPETEPREVVPVDESPVVTGLFADVVFDRPLDHAYTYAVPDGLRAAVAVGKRVEAPFGRGDRSTVGYCVRVHGQAPERAVKSIDRVLDDEPIITDSLLRLTRWMADYYLCGWGQVLNAVVPAGARHQAGVREAVFVEAVPLEELPEPRPPLTNKQIAAIKQLRQL